MRENQYFVIGNGEVGSRVTKLIGFNKESTFYGPSLIITYYVTGLDGQWAGC